MASILPCYHCFVSFVFFICALCPLATGQQPTSLQYTVREQLSPGTLVGDISTDAGLGAQFSLSDWRNGAVSFTLSSTQFSVQALFRLSSQGILSTAITIDRESFCPRKVTCDFAMTVQAQSPQLFLQVTVVVSVSDIPDSVPFFQPPSFQLTVSESAQAGTSFPLPLADDLDSPRYAISTYSITQSTAPGVFALQQTNSSDGSVENLMLLLVGKLNREVFASCHVIVTAVDVNNPTLTGRLQVNVSITDVNDNAPTFTKAMYVIDVPENTQPGTTLLTVTATDADSGANGQVSYSLSERSQREVGNLFSINSVTGALSLSEVLDYEAMTTYSFSIVAKVISKFLINVPSKGSLRIRCFYW